jgi:hypothetical protein
LVVLTIAATFYDHSRKKERGEIGKLEIVLLVFIKLLEVKCRFDVSMVSKNNSNCSIISIASERKQVKILQYSTAVIVSVNKS